MGICHTFKDELLVMGILFGKACDRQAVYAALEEHFGALEHITEETQFGWTDYYDREMGEGISRVYVMFRELVDPSALADIKAATNDIEGLFTSEGRRSVNLDPGLLAPGRFVLATTKDRAHRIALSDGIFAELTLIYEKGSFRALPWTYPDWADEAARTLLKEWRKTLFPAKP